MAEKDIRLLYWLSIYVDGTKFWSWGDVMEELI